MTTDRQKQINYARRFLESSAEAEDAVQDTYLRAFDTFTDWRAPDQAWMFAVLRNLAIDRHRRLRTESLYAQAGSIAVESPASPLEVQSECQAALRHLLRRVSAIEAAVMVLRDVFDFEYREIAQSLGKSEAAIRQMLHRARLRAQGVKNRDEVDEFLFGLFCRAIETREPALLMKALPGSRAHLRAAPTGVGHPTCAGSTSMLVHVDGHYAIALVLNGVILCIVPVGAADMHPNETV
jgi:RNA polymerase sigma factor (sigma-70 family)